MLMKDVVLTPDHPKELLLQKHADYIASYGVNKDEYVSSVEWQIYSMEKTVQNEQELG